MDQIKFYLKYRYIYILNHLIIHINHLFINILQISKFQYLFYLIIPAIKILIFHKHYYID